MKFRLALHIIAQVLGQAAVAALIPASIAKYYAAAIAVVGVLVAFFDTSTQTPPAQ